VTVPSIESVKAAQKRIKNIALRIPLVRLNIQSDYEIFLKLENLQPISSFKIRAACNAITVLKETGALNIDKGVWTASAGNFGAGLAWMAKQFSIRCTIVVPDHAPEAKLSVIQQFNPDAKIIKVEFSKWWDIIMTHEFEEDLGSFIHPVANDDVLAGNATIGLEIIEDLPDVDTVIVPYGGGALSVGIASVLKHHSDKCAVFASEVETAAPLSAALACGNPVHVPYTPSFVDGIGSKDVLEVMWPLVKTYLAGSIVCSLQEIAAAIKLIAEKNKVIAEGAGASSVAAAIKKSATGELGKKIVCVVSGGSINKNYLISILQGNTPTKE